MSSFEAVARDSHQIREEYLRTDRLDDCPNLLMHLSQQQEVDGTSPVRNLNKERTMFRSQMVGNWHGGSARRRYAQVVTVTLCLCLAAGTASAADATGAKAPGGSLKDTILSTLYYTPDVKQFQEYRQAAEHDVNRARSGWLPRVDARMGWGMEQWSSENTRNNKDRGWGQNSHSFYERSEASIVVQQTIWDGLATSSRHAMGVARLDSAVQRLLDNSEAATLDALLAHVDVYRQRRLVKLAEMNVQNHKDILKSQKERQRHGAAVIADVTQTQSRLSRAQASLTESRAALEVAMAQYKRLTGKDPVNLEAPYAPQNPYPSLKALLANSQNNNPKIKALKADVEAAKAQIKLDQSAYHPQVYLEAGPTYSWQTQGSNTYDWGTSVMLRVSWNLFDGFYDKYNVKGSTARMRQAREQMNSQMHAVAQEGASSWSYLLSAVEQSKFFETAVENSTKTRDAYREQFNAGQRSLLDILDAENELYSFSIQLVTSRLNEIAIQYKLKAIGGELLVSMGFDPSLLKINTDNIAHGRGKYVNTNVARD